MGNRFFVAIVILLWLVAMSWLFVAKILPPFGQGRPPSYIGLSADTQSCWRVFLNDEPIGWAASRVIAGTNATKDIHARLLLDDVHFANMAPDWKQRIEAMNLNLGSIDMDARSRIEVDPNGKLSAVEVKVKLDPLPVDISLRGRVEGSALKLRFQTGAFSKTMDWILPDNARLGADMSPDAKLPGMYVGRRWQMQVINPIPLPGIEPTHLVEAEVVGEEIIRFGSRLETTRRLDYRRTDMVGADGEQVVESRQWIAEDGDVLRQEATVLGSKLRFDRLIGPEAREKADALLAPLIGIPGGATMKN